MSRFWLHFEVFQRLLRYLKLDIYLWFWGHCYRFHCKQWLSIIWWKHDFLCRGCSKWIYPGSCLHDFRECKRQLAVAEQVEAGEAYYWAHN